MDAAPPRKVLAELKVKQQWISSAGEDDDEEVKLECQLCVLAYLLYLRRKCGENIALQAPEPIVPGVKTRTLELFGNIGMSCISPFQAYLLSPLPRPD
jgi:hypothetical protein